MALPTETDYSSWTHSNLLARVNELERQLWERTFEPTARSNLTPGKGSSKPRRTKAFDPSKYSTRHIALKIAYLGRRYNGYEHANGNTTPMPTIEEMLWIALRKAALISPPVLGDMEVAWSRAERARGSLFINWDGCQYSKCGRTDKGVSAAGQVIGIRVRSNRPVRRPENTSAKVDLDDDAKRADSVTSGELPGFDDNEPVREVDFSFDPVKDELPYISILNAVLPSDIRVLAWCPNPPDDFDARFSCGERRYKYFFTNPAFLPTPGPIGLKDANGKATSLREGWLDIDAMREGAKKLLGLHDFRNFCRVDASKQLTAFERRITNVEIEEVAQQNGPTAFAEQPHLAKDAGTKTLITSRKGTNTPGTKVYCFTVHGSAFLWHQVRHMVAVLFLVGQRLESPSLVDELLDIEKTKCRPTYEMASDTPLVLWDCIFPKDKTQSRADDLEWIYAGDARGMPGLTTKGDGKYSLGGVVDELWTNWRKHKIDETLASATLDLAISQGDASTVERGGFRSLDTVRNRSQKIFDGSETARMVGKYVPVMDKPKMDTVDVQNANYRNGKGFRRQARKAQESSGDE